MPKAKNDAEVYANAEKNIKKLKAGKLGRVAKLKRMAKEVIGGEMTYLPKGSPKPKKPKKKKKKSALTDYARKSGGGQFTGASGNDLAELQKKFGGK